MYYKGIVRLDDWSRYSLPPVGEPITVTVENGQGEQVYQDTVVLNGLGTFNGEFDLSDAAPLGNYSLSANIADGEQSFSASFQVAEYRRPQFEVTVVTDKPEYLQGEKIAVHTKAQYYFGGPAADAAVHWTVLTDDAPFNYTGAGWYDFTDYDWTQGRYYGGYGGQILEGNGKTDAKGELTFYVPADIADKINSQRYTIEATVTDLNDQQVSAQAEAVIHKGLFYVGVAPATYVGTVDKKADVNVITVDWDSQPYAKVPVTIVFNRHVWYSVQEKAEDGSFYWNSKYVDTPIFTTTITTDVDGKAVATFTPTEGGIYKVVATAQDDYENVVRSSTFLWVSSRQFVNWRQENNDRIDLVADKKLYKVGDIAEVLIPSPYQGTVAALLTIERGGVISHTLMTLQDNSQSVLIPILPEYAPDVYVSVALVKGQDVTNPLASFKLGYVTLKVSTEEKQLKVVLTPDKQQYRPGDTVTYTVQTTDYAGNGKEAELSLNLVDKSVLALADFTGGTLMDTFWAERGVGVQTAASLVLSVDRQNLEVAPSAKGGGGGGPGEAGTVRRQFPETAYWNPVVTTDAAGHAQVKLVLPDTLTTWNMSAKAVTADTEVGEAAVDVKSTKPLHVRSVLPRFLVVGDKAVVGAIVNNETDNFVQRPGRNQCRRRGYRAECNPAGRCRRARSDASQLGRDREECAYGALPVQFSGRRPARCGGIHPTGLSLHLARNRGHRGPGGGRRDPNRAGAVAATPGYGSGRPAVGARPLARCGHSRRPELPGDVPVLLHRADDQPVPAQRDDLPGVEEAQCLERRAGAEAAEVRHDGPAAYLRLAAYGRRLGLVVSRRHEPLLDRVRGLWTGSGSASRLRRGSNRDRFRGKVPEGQPRQSLLVSCLTRQTARHSSCTCWPTPVRVIRDALPPCTPSAQR